jgi:hypothetical protein
MHDGHTEPSVASHAIGMWLFAIPAVWIVGDWLGYWGAAVAAFAAWLPVCWSVSASLSCRNANQMGSRNYNKSLALAAAPYAALFAYFVYYLNTAT